MARTLTWDRGPEMTRHREFSMHTKIPVFFNWHTLFSDKTRP